MFFGFGWVFIPQFSIIGFHYHQVSKGEQKKKRKEECVRDSVE